MNRKGWMVIARTTLVLAVFSGCGMNRPDASNAVGNKVTGILTSREKIALPRDVLIRVELLDVSLKDGPPRTIAMQEILTDGRQLPIPFEIPYRLSIIDPDRAYALRVKIFQGHSGLFANSSPQNVITNGVRSNVQVMLESVSGSGGISR